MNFTWIMLIELITMQCSTYKNLRHIDFFYFLFFVCLLCKHVKNFAKHTVGNLVLFNLYFCFENALDLICIVIVDLGWFSSSSSVADIRCESISIAKRRGKTCRGCPSCRFGTRRRCYRWGKCTGMGKEWQTKNASCRLSCGGLGQDYKVCVYNSM